MSNGWDNLFDGLTGALDEIENAVKGIEAETERLAETLDPIETGDWQPIDGKMLVPVAEALPESEREFLLEKLTHSLGPDQRRELAESIVEDLSSDQMERFIEAALNVADEETKKRIKARLASGGKKAAVLAALFWFLDKLAEVFIQAPVETVADETWNWLRRVTSKLLHPLMPEMVTIPAGGFLMGSDPAKDEDSRSWERPQHSIYLPKYHIAKYPVTNAQYAAFVQATGHEAPRHWENGKIPSGKKDHPVVYVSWYEAVDYCRWLSKVTGRSFTLPSEAEWEKAARGTGGQIYPWGGDRSPTPDLCNFGRNVGDTTPVGEYSPAGDSPYDCADMAGNVWEWTRSIYKDYHYDLGDGREDIEAEGYRPRLVRGGSFASPAASVRCAARNGLFPVDRYWDGGFRVVVAPFSPPSDL